MQSATSNTGQWIARFNYGGATANTGTNVLTVAKDNSYFLNVNVGIGRDDPGYPLDIFKSSSTSGSATGTTVQRLWNYVGSDLSQQKTFIDFVFQDDNDNEYPQVRIGAEVGQNADANSTIKEGSGAFVVYTNNATGSTPGANSLTERMRVDYAGNVGINDTSPSHKLSVVGTANFTGLVSGITPTATANFATKGYVDSVTPGAGPFLPLTGGTLTGGLTGTTAAFSASISASGNSNTFGNTTIGALSASTGTFSASVTAAGNSNSFGTTTFTSDAGVIIYTTTTQAGAKITFSDEASSRSQKGFITYRHLDPASYGSGNAFIISGDQATMTILADGKLMYKEGVYLKPATGTGAGTRKDNLWDAGYAYSQIGHLPLSGGTMSGTLTMNGQTISMVNGAITNVNNLTFNDPGAGEGIQWLNGNGWQIYESPNSQTNAAGNLQFVENTTRRMTIDTSGNVEIVSGSLGIKTPSPGFSLDVYSPTTNVVGQFESGDNQAWISVRDDGYTTYGAMLGCDHDLGLEVILANNAATRRLIINNSGEVGIGEDSPADKLDVNGAILCNNRVQIDGVDDAGNVTGSEDSLRATGYGLMGNRTGQIYITNGNSAAGAKIVLGVRGAHNANNKLVIGDTLSYFNNNKLLVNKTVDDGGQLQVASSTTSGSIRIGGANGVGQSRVYIESNGNNSYIDSFGGNAYQNLAIQAAVIKLQTTTSPSRRVDLGTQTWAGYGSNPIARLNIEVEGGNALNIFNTAENAAYLRFIDSQSNGSQYAFFSFSSGAGNPFIINNMGANAFYIAGDGYGGVGMGGSPSTGVAGDRLKITGDNNGLGCIKAISGQYSYGVRIEGSNLSTQLALYTSSTSQTTQINFEVAGNSSAGKITTTTNTTTYTTSSDYRLKENIIPISDSISRINQLKPSRFNFIQEPNKIVDGFIAHEVQEIVPEAIVGEKDEVDKDGNPVHQGIDQATEMFNSDEGE